MAETIRGINEAGRPRPVGVSADGQSETGVQLGALHTEDVTLAEMFAELLLELRAVRYGLAVLIDKGPALLLEMAREQP